MSLRPLLAALATCVFAVNATAQALPSLISLRVNYNTRKNIVKPEGELQSQIAALDREIADAFRVGRGAEARRLLAKGMTLLNGKEWTDAADYGASLVLRSERVVIDSSKPYGFRLEQLYAPSLPLTQSPSARVSLWQRRDTAPPQKRKDLAQADAIGRDLRETPFWFDVDLRDFADGVYQLQVEVLDGGRSLGTAMLTVALRKGLDETLTGLEAAAQAAPEPVRADILFPADRVRSVNRGQLELRTFNLQRDLAAAEESASAARAGRDPFAARRGDFKRHYRLEPANEIIPYRMYVPNKYTGAKPFPLIVALHGLGGTEDAMFEGYGKQLPALAEERGYIVAAPLGYRIDGGYGWGLGPPPPDAVYRRHLDLSEQDVMEVLRRVQQLYQIDASRIYLMGHSMGAIGTWKLAAKYPHLWAALAPFAGIGVPSTHEAARHIPELVVHGDADRTVDVRGSRAMVAKLKELGTDVVYVEVPGGSHGGVVAPNLPRMFDFFDAHAKPLR